MAKMYVWIWTISIHVANGWTWIWFWGFGNSQHFHIWMNGEWKMIWNIQHVHVSMILLKAIFNFIQLNRNYKLCFCLAFAHIQTPNIEQANCMSIWLCNHFLSFGFWENSNKNIEPAIGWTCSCVFVSRNNSILIIRVMQWMPNSRNRYIVEHTHTHTQKTN